MKHLQQYQFAYTSSKHLVKNHYLSIDKNPTASQKNMKNLLTQNICHLSPVSLPPLVNL
jgi:hypothetical protein